MHITSQINKQFTFTFLMKIFISTFVSIAVIYNSGYALVTIGNDLSIMLLFPATILMFFLTFFLRIDKLKININILFYFGILLGVMITVLANLDVTVINSYIRFILVISISFCITTILPFDKFIELFIKVMKFVSSISLIIYILINFFNAALPVATVINTNEISYLNGIIFFVLEHAPERNTGIFWEPGIFSSFLIIALICEICFKSKLNKVNIALFVITLLTTLSTAGYFLLLLVAFLYLNHRSEKNISFLMNIFLLGIIIICITQSASIINFLGNRLPNVFGKISDTSGSVITRVEGPLVDLKIFLEEPFFGVGFVDYQLMWKNLTLFTEVSAQTSTVTYFIATMGLLGFFYVFGWVIGILRISSLNLMSRITIFLIFLLILSKEPHQHNVVIFIFFFYFLSYKSKSNNNAKKINKNLVLIKSNPIK